MLFERFRRPRWQHRDPGVRREAMQRLSWDVEDEAAILRSAAFDDPDPAVRSVAVKRLHELALLRSVMNEDTDAAVREVAGVRYRQMLVGGSRDVEAGDDEIEMRIAEIEYCDDAQILAHVARRAREEAVRAAALARISDPRVLEESALHDAVARLRQFALERLTDVEALRRVAEQGRHSDRRIARLARERVEAVDAARRERDLLLSEANRLCVAAEEIQARTPLQGTEQAEIDRLRNRWAALGELPEDAPSTRFDAAVKAAESRLGVEAERTRVESFRRAQSLSEEVAELERAAEPPAYVLARLEQRLDSLRGAGGDSVLRAREWLRAGRRYHDLRADLRTAVSTSDVPRARRLCERLDWPDNLPTPEPLAEAQRLLANPPPAPAAETAGTVDAASVAEDDRRQAVIAAVNARLDRVEAAIGKGHLKPAAKQLREARSEGERIPGELPPALDRRLARAAARVAELRDWRRFAVLPKQQQLCDAMESLVGDAELTPPERAQRIKELQSRWKATGGSDSPESRALWARFSEAAERAFEPCREWFDREAERRRENLAARETICRQLNEFVGSVDLNAQSAADLDRIRRTAREEWRASGPVDRSEAREITARFEDLMDRITEVINRQRDAAGERKQRIVDEAKALAEGDDVEHAAARAKALQGEWKQCGQARPSRERALWREFRAACDEIFARRDRERDEVRNVKRREVSEGEALCAELEALPDGDIGGARELDAAIAELKQRFAGVSLPDDRVGRAVALRFERAVAEARARSESIAKMRALSALHSALEQGLGLTPDALPDEAPDALRQALQDTASEALGLMGDDPHRDLCVRMEILGGLESPAADEELRMQHQVERLSRGFGGGPADRDEELERWSLVAAWLQLPAATDEALTRRFIAALDAAAEV